MKSKAVIAKSKAATVNKELEAISMHASCIARDARALVFEFGVGDWRAFVAQTADLLDRLARAIKAKP